MAFLASLATAVAPSIVSGLFGRKKNKAQGVDYQKLVNDATAAGFNPLTALRNGGSQAYTREPVLSSTSFIGEALGKGLQTAFNHKEQEAQAKKEKLEIEIMEAQLESIQNSNKNVGGEYFGFNIPSASQTTGAANARNPRRSGPSLSGGPNRVAGVDIVESDKWSDTEDMEERYGDLVGAVHGVAVATADTKETIKAKFPAWSKVKRDQLSSSTLAEYARSARAVRKGRYYGPPPPPKLTQRRVYPSMRFPNTHYSNGPS